MAITIWVIPLHILLYVIHTDCFLSLSSIQGLSGNPLVCLDDDRYILVGINSWGQGCGDPKHPDVYTRVKPLTPWMLHTMDSESWDIIYANIV